MPNDIVDLIGLEDNSQVCLSLEEKNDRHLLVYSVLKNNTLVTHPEPEVYNLNAAAPSTSSRVQGSGNS